MKSHSSPSQYPLCLFFLGSATLQHWQQLAQPNLGGILDARPGVVPKGYRPLELDLEEVYHYADYEEDEPGDQYFQNLPTTTTSNPSVPPAHSIAPSASPSPCLSTGHASIEFSSKSTCFCVLQTACIRCKDIYVIIKINNTCVSKNTFSCMYEVRNGHMLHNV